MIVNLMRKINYLRLLLKNREVVKAAVPVTLSQRDQSSRGNLILPLVGLLAQKLTVKEKAWKLYHKT